MQAVSEYQIFTADYEGWVRAGFDHKRVELKIRKVGDAAQVEVEISEVKGKRCYVHVGSIELSAQNIACLIQALSEAAQPDAQKAGEEAP